MNLPFLEPLLTCVGLLSLSVFVFAFKFAIQEAAGNRENRYEPELPRAALCNRSGTAGQRWMRGAGKQRVIGHLPFVQAGLVAFGITSTFIMFLCMAGVVVTMFLAH